MPTTAPSRPVSFDQVPEAKLRRLIELRARVRSREHLAGYVADPVGWVRSRLGEHVWSRQADVMAAVVAHRRVAVRSAHGVGKSHLASRLAAWWLDTHPPGEAFVVTTAPTYAQVRAILWRYIRQAHRKGRLPGRVNQTEWHLPAGGEMELVGFGRKPSDTDEAAFQGIHARFVLVILDEACGIPEQLWVAADALTTNPDCRILAIGNPDNPASHFRRVCEPGSGWHVQAISALDTPNLTGEPVPDGLAGLLVSAGWVAEKAAEWGTDSPLYQAKVLGVFPSDDPHAVVRASDAALCRIGGLDWAPDRLLPVVLGVDVGGGGDDTVIRERRGVQAGREWTHRSDRPEDLAPLLLKVIRETGASAVHIDSIGVGHGLVGELRNLARLGDHHARVVPVNVAERASEPSRFANLRAELWWSVGREGCEQRTWDLSVAENADRAVSQMLEPRWDVDPKGRIRVEPKDEIRKRLGRSPDHADALLLAFYTPPAGPSGFLDQLVAERGAG